MKETLAVINQMKADGVVGKYAIGGAVGATFYLEPFATIDIDIFVAFNQAPGSLLVSISPIYDYLTARGHTVEGCNFFRLEVPLKKKPWSRRLKPTSTASKPGL